MNLFKEFFKDWRIVAVIIVIITIWLLSSCTRDDMEPRLRKYTVQEGSHDFTPSPFPKPSNAKTFKGQARIHASCWYDVLGVDNADWNKLAGVYRFADVVKNKNSFILAWRPLNAIKNRFELCLYENIDGANVPHDSAIYQVSGGQLFDFELVYTNNKYSMYVDGNLLGTQRNDVTYNWIAKISAWFGGNQSAPWTMWLEMDF